MCNGNTTPVRLKRRLERRPSFGKLPKRIATDARRIAQELVETRVKTIAPWAAKEISVG